MPVSFANPVMLWALGLLIPLVVLHLLRFRPRRIEVPSLRLWRESREEPIANAPWQAIKQPLELLLQALALTFIVLALAGIQIPEGSRQRSQRLFVLDNTPSMLALTASGRTRFDEARAWLSAELSSMSANGYAGLATLGESLELLVPPGSSPAEVQERLQDLRCQNKHDRPQTRQRQLAELASAFRAVASIEYLTGPVSDSDIERLPGSLAMRTFGEAQANSAILAARLEARAGRVMLMASVGHFGQRDAKPLAIVERIGAQGDASLVATQPISADAFELDLGAAAEPGSWRLRMEQGDRAPADDSVELIWHVPPAMRASVEGPDVVPALLERSLAAFGNTESDQSRPVRGRLLLLSPETGAIDGLRCGPVANGVVSHSLHDWWEGYRLEPLKLETPTLVEPLPEGWQPLLWVESKPVAALRERKDGAIDLALSLDLDAEGPNAKALNTASLLPILIGSWWQHHEGQIQSQQRAKTSAAAHFLNGAESQQVAKGQAMRLEGRTTSVDQTSAYPLWIWLLALAIALLVADVWLYLKRRGPLRPARKQARAA